MSPTCYSPVCHSRREQALSYHSTCMLKTRRQRSFWARIKLSMIILKPEGLRFTFSLSLFSFIKGTLFPFSFCLTGNRRFIVFRFFSKSASDSRNSSVRHSFLTAFRWPYSFFPSLIFFSKTAVKTLLRLYFSGFSQCLKPRTLLQSAAPRFSRVMWISHFFYFYVNTRNDKF